MNDIPADVALGMCREIRDENRGRWYSFYGMWCWGCYTFSGRNPEKMCFSNSPGNRGCSQVNKKYDNMVSG
ncbi:hypothetical protein ACFLYN_02355 [Chloroflexota bacterium]